FPDAGLSPAPGDRLRGPYYRWLFFAAGPGEAATSNRAFGFVVPEGRERMIGYGSYKDVMNALEAAVSQGDYLVGDRFTAADVYVGSHIGFGLQFGTFEKRAAFERYVARLGARAAFQRAQGIDYRHIRTLGGLRHKPKDAPPSPNTLWRSDPFRNYADYALTEPLRAGLAELRGLAQQHVCAIMCAEAVWWRCHRRIVADYLL